MLSELSRYSHNHLCCQRHMHLLIQMWAWSPTISLNERTCCNINTSTVRKIADCSSVLPLRFNCYSNCRHHCGKIVSVAHFSHIQPTTIQFKRPFESMTRIHNKFNVLTFAVLKTTEAALFPVREYTALKMTQPQQLFKDISNQTAMNLHQAQLIYVLESSQHYSVKRASAHWRGNFPNRLGRSAL